MIELALLTSLAIPLAVALLFVLVPIASERTAARFALTGTALSVGASAVAIALWLAAGAAPFHSAAHVLFHQGSFRFTFTLVLDSASAVFLALIQFITGLVIRFSRFYLHREPGFQRFFATVLAFQTAMCLLALAGNLDLMFAAWEMVGLSSFLLIAFYRERQSAVRNALKTYSVYRIADIGMLVAACLETSGERRSIGLFVLLAAMGKSAQFPFSFWVARAMEGPTPSSALFYGALSVHAGAYLLIRTFDLWSGALMVHLCVGGIGIVTAVLCSMFSRVQPTIKGQIGYASVTQVGVIFVEIALGLTHLALLHIVSNAILRCYQLLVSPSVVAHRLRRQATAGAARATPARSLYARLIPNAFRPTLYVFALSEGYLKDLLKVAIWFPLRRLGTAILPWRKPLLVVGPLGAAAGLALLRGGSRTTDLGLASALLILAVTFSACGLALWRRPAHAVAWISGSSLFAAAAMLALSEMNGSAATFYTLSILLSCALGLGGLVAATFGQTLGARFFGLVSVRPISATVSFVGALGLAGFPLLPTFWGEDALMSATLGESRAFSIALAAILALNGYLAVRNFAYTFFGRVAREAPVPQPKCDTRELQA